MRVSGLDHTNFRVADAERSIAFYRDVLGLVPERLEELARGETPLLTFRIDEGAILHLRPTEGFRGAARPGRRSSGWCSRRRA